MNRRLTHRWVLLIWLLVSGMGAYFSLKLYANLKTNLDELLPTSARSVVDTVRIKHSLQSTDNLAVLVFSKDVGASKRFINDFSHACEREASDLITYVEYRIDRELDFFKKRQALFLPVSELKKIHKFILARIEYEHELHNPLNIFSEATIPEPKLELRPPEGRMAHSIVDFTRFPDGYYASADRSVRVALLYMKGAALSTDAAIKLRHRVDGIIARLKPSSYARDLSVRFTGDVENLIEEHDSLVDDLKLSTALVTLLVTLSILLFYRSLRGTLALVLSTLAGTFATFGISWFTQGYLNGNSAFLGSIVIGNGINFGIVMLARYFEARRQPWPVLGHDEALALATSQTRMATLTAALGAALAYGSLILTEFRGFRQFGAIGLVGMICCWISAYTLLPALLTTFDRRKSLATPAQSHLEQHGFAGTMAWILSKLPVLLVVLAITATVATVIGWHRHTGPLIETNTATLRNKKSMESGSGYLSKYLDEIFGRYISPVVIMADSTAHAREIAAGVESVKRSGGPAGTFISSIYSIDSFIPRDQGAKIAVLNEIRELIPRPLMSQLSKSVRKRLESLLTPEVRRPFGPANLPYMLRQRFLERDGALGRLVLVEPIFDPIASQQFEGQKAFIEALRKVADSVRPGTPVVGTLPLTVDLVSSVSHDGPKATFYAFLAVALLVTLLFRRPSHVLETLAALILGVVWMSGGFLLWGLKVNFLNFIAIPITIGIGVDYGVNIVQRYRAEGRADIVRVIRGTGAAVALASFTTIIGYSSLLIAGNQGFVSFGRLAVLGEITCLLGALWGVPAYLKLREGKPREPAPTQLRPEKRHDRAA